MTRSMRVAYTRDPQARSSVKIKLANEQVTHRSYHAAADLRTATTDPFRSTPTVGRHRLENQ